MAEELADIEAAVVKILVDDTTVFTYVRNRIYPGFSPPREDHPYIAYERIATLTDFDLLGPTGLVEVRLMLLVCTPNDKARRVIAKAIRNAIHIFDNGTIEQFNIDWIRVDDESDDNETNDAMNRSLDVLVTYSEG